MLAAAFIDWLPLLLGGAVGFLLAVLGLRGRRVGDTPHCRKCAYNLTGLTSERCPECGSVLSSGAIVQGVHQRRGLFVVGGVVLFLVCFWSLGTVAYQRARTVNVRAYYPFGWLLSGARGGGKRWTSMSC